MAKFSPYTILELPNLRIDDALQDAGLMSIFMDILGLVGMVFSEYGKDYFTVEGFTIVRKQSEYYSDSSISIYIAQRPSDVLPITRDAINDDHVGGDPTKVWEDGKWIMHGPWMKRISIMLRKALYVAKDVLAELEDETIKNLLKMAYQTEERRKRLSRQWKDSMG